MEARLDRKRPRASVLCAMSVAWALQACGGANPPPREPPTPATPPTAQSTDPVGSPVATMEEREEGVLTLDVKPGQSIEAWRSDAAKRLPAGECAFTWGDVGEVPAGTRRARISWQGGSVDGVVLCDDALGAKMKDRRLHQVVMVQFRRHEAMGLAPLRPGAPRIHPAGRGGSTARHHSLCVLRLQGEDQRQQMPRRACTAAERCPLRHAGDPMKKATRHSGATAVVRSAAG